MMKNKKIGTYIDNRTEEAYNFEFYTDLSVADKVGFVDSVVDLVVNENHYNSVIRDLVFDFFVVDIFTNVDTDKFKKSSIFLNDVEEFLEDTNIVEIVEANMKTGLLEELNKAVDKSIEYLTGIHPSPLGEALASLVNTLEKKVNEIDLDGMMDMVNVFAGMTEGLTPENIIDAYMNSDAHKKNQVEIDESKKLRAEFAADIDKAIKEVTKKKKK